MTTFADRYNHTLPTLDKIIGMGGDIVSVSFSIDNLTVYLTNDESEALTIAEEVKDAGHMGEAVDNVFEFAVTAGEGVYLRRVLVHLVFGVKLEQ